MRPAGAPCMLGTGRRTPRGARQPLADALERGASANATNTVSSPAMLPTTSGQRARSSAAAMAWASPARSARPAAVPASRSRWAGRAAAGAAAPRRSPRPRRGAAGARRPGTPVAADLDQPQLRDVAADVAWVARKPRSRSAAASSCWVRIGRCSSRSRIGLLAQLLHDLHVSHPLAAQQDDGDHDAANTERGRR